MRRLVGLALQVLTIFSLLAIFVPIVSAETIEIGPGEDLQQAVNALKPGDKLVLQGGTYVLPSRFSIYQKEATGDLPIVIQAKEGEVPVIKYPSEEQNVINVEQSRHIVLRGLEVTGGSQGIRLDNSNFITVENCHIHHTGDTALSANRRGTYQGLKLLRNHIRYTDGSGHGIALGCDNENTCQVYDSVIEGNYIHHTDGPNVTQGAGIKIGEGSYNNRLIDNVIHDTKAHPCIFTDSTMENGEPNIIEGNFLWDCHDHGIQATADAVIRNNIISRASWDGIRSQRHGKGVPSNLKITHNTVIAPTNNAVTVVRAPTNNAVGSNNLTGTPPILIANNAFFAEVGNAIKVSGVTELIVKGNAGSGDTIGFEGGFDGSLSIASDFEAASYGPLPLVVFPSDGSGLIDKAEPAYSVADDFNRNARQGLADIGAYEWQSGGNPGWRLAEAFKRISPPTQ